MKVRINRFEPFANSALNAFMRRVGGADGTPVSGWGLRKNGKKGVCQISRKRFCSGNILQVSDEKLL